MGIHQELVDFNTVFHKLSQPPIIVNDLRNDTEDRREQIRDLITSRFSSDMVSMIPSCLCGAKQGFYTTFKEEDRLCKKCNTLVRSEIEDDIEPGVWFRKPNDVPPIINPMIWIMLRHRFSKSRFNIIQWLCDTTYRPKGSQPKIVAKLVEAGIQRGYHSFYENFDMIIEYLFSLKEFKLTKRDKTDYLYLLIKQDRHKVFSNYIPFPNKTLLIIEKTNVGIYIDAIVVNAMNAIEMLISIDQDYHEQNPRLKANRMVKALDALCTYHEDYFKSNLSVKTGMFRRHIFGTRTNFAFRAVITSITGPHKHDEIEVPWGVGLTAFRPHLVNKLKRLGWDHNAIIGLLYGHINKYHPLLDKLLQELINESNIKHRITTGTQRNPSLKQGSFQRVFISKFKTDVTDLSLGVSILICRAFNAELIGLSNRKVTVVFSLIAGISCKPLHHMYRESRCRRLNK